MGTAIMMAAYWTQYFTLNNNKKKINFQNIWNILKLLVFFYLFTRNVSWLCEASVLSLEILKFNCRLCSLCWFFFCTFQWARWVFPCGFLLQSFCPEWRKDRRQDHERQDHGWHSAVVSRVYLNVVRKNWKCSATYTTPGAYSPPNSYFCPLNSACPCWCHLFPVVVRDAVAFVSTSCIAL